MHYVADTHSFLWYLADSPKLSHKARAVFDAADQGRATIILPAVVLLECIDVFDKKKIDFQFEKMVSKILNADNFIFSEMNWVLILKVDDIKGLKDLHDRVIVATAELFSASLISKDKEIKRFYGRTVW